MIPTHTLTVAQASRELGISTKRVRELIVNGSLGTAYTQQQTGYLTVSRAAVLLRKKRFPPKGDAK